MGGKAEFKFTLYLRENNLVSYRKVCPWKSQSSERSQQKGHSPDTFVQRKGSRRKYSWWSKDWSRQKHRYGDREMWLAVRALDGVLNTRNDNVVIKRCASG